MHSAQSMKCPRCGKEMEPGFSARSSPLSFATGEQVKEFVHQDEDLNRAGWKTLLPSKASYNAACHCRACRILVVDYSRPISSREAKRAIAAAS